MFRDPLLALSRVGYCFHINEIGVLLMFVCLEQLRCRGVSVLAPLSTYQVFYSFTDIMNLISEKDCGRI